MFIHGITNPTCRQVYVMTSPKASKELFEEYLKIRNEVGMGGQPLYYDAGRTGRPISPEALEELKEKAKKVIELCKSYDIPGVYFYGLDEARGKLLKAQRPAWKAVHDAGGKVFVSGYIGISFEAMGDIQDLFICAGNPSKEEATKWHSVGHKIFCYGNPQTGPENPEVYRRNYGLLLWKANYDGAATYCYQTSYGNIWNDFDYPSYRDHNFAYPTVNGTIDTIALEGYREGVDDIRYATTLRLAIEEAKYSRDRRIRKEAIEAWKYLEQLDVKNRNLDTIRLEIINYILKLKKEIK